jgi:type II secretion system protein H
VCVHTERGFTLLELLVSLMIISLMTAVVGFSITGHEQRILKSEGDKLAAKLNAAQSHIAAGAASLRLVATKNGYSFEEAERTTIDNGGKIRWRSLPNDEILDEHTLPSGAVLQIKVPILIADEPIGLPEDVYLVQGEAKVHVATDGVQGWAAQ